MEILRSTARLAKVGTMKYYVIVRLLDVGGDPKKNRHFSLTLTAVKNQFYTSAECTPHDIRTLVWPSGYTQDFRVKVHEMTKERESEDDWDLEAKSFLQDNASVWMKWSLDVGMIEPVFQLAHEFISRKLKAPQTACDPEPLTALLSSLLLSSQYPLHC